jgi:hypothetical protein
VSTIITGLIEANTPEHLIQKLGLKLPEKQKNALFDPALQQNHQRKDRKDI